jgi:hypothetical protein
MALAMISIEQSQTGIELSIAAARKLPPFPGVPEMRFS